MIEGNRIPTFYKENTKRSQEIFRKLLQKLRIIFYT